MKASEFITEGIISDLRTAGRRNQAQMKSDVSQWAQTQASRLVPQKVKSAYQSMQQYAQRAAQGYVPPETPAEPKHTGIKVPSNRRLQIIDPNSNGKYFKDAYNHWTNEAGQRIRREASIDYLEKLAAKTTPVFVPI